MRQLFLRLIAFATMAAAWLAISGIFPLSGFWSKDEILAATFAHGGAWYVLYAIGVLVAVLTAFFENRQHKLLNKKWVALGLAHDLSS